LNNPVVKHEPIGDIAVFSEILRERYKTGFPILKEIVQNADDTGGNHLSTGIESNVSKTVVGVYGNLITNNQILFDWQVLDILNIQKLGKHELDVSNIQPNDLSDCKTNCLEFLKNNISKLKLPYTIPEIDVLAILWPL
jgi:hypothetical protein